MRTNIFFLKLYLFLFRICLGNFNHKWYLFIGCLSVGPFFKKGRYRPPIGRSGNTGRIRVYAWKAQRSLRCPARSQYYGFTRFGQFGFVGPPRIGYNLYKIALLAFGAVREVCLPGLRYLGKSFFSQTCFFSTNLYIIIFLEISFAGSTKLWWIVWTRRILCRSRCKLARLFQFRCVCLQTQPGYIR